MRLIAMTLSISTMSKSVLTRSVDENSDPGFSVEQAQDLGRIQVIVKRIKIKKLASRDIPDAAPVAMISEVPEKALKGRPIDTTVR